ncbi:complement C1q-like protein 2 [Engraulis encrasicolus]|uniref:complement C1q-like protein 2 n=1 Tax=Engraulis encrasicolus TaxID=184585 RepID=UPI002FD01D51
MMKMKIKMMKNVALLFVAVGCCVCEPQTSCGEESSSSCAICSVTQGIAMLMEKVKLLETRLEKSEKDVEELRGLIGGRPQVAFSVGLLDSNNGNTGPFTEATPLKYKKVFSNMGSCYNPSTGVFTALVKGMYFFRFTMFNHQVSSPKSVVYLKRNGQVVASVWDMGAGDSNDTGSNAAVIPLEVGDNVWVELRPNTVVYDDSGLSLTTLSGFLIFPM